MIRDANGTELKVGDKVMIPAVVTALADTPPDYQNGTMRATLNFGADGTKESILTVGTMQVIKLTGEHA